ncbi:MAG: hypothetical protein H6745_31725 [Deltaproteobacteria bacterium]|nr:hypothetical protein [Deltaproteobacteria bacterium]
MLYGLIFGAGLARCCYLLDLGGRLDWFVAGDFEHGVELGVEARFGFAKDASPLLARDGLTGGVTAGYRVVLGAGFTLEAQLALVVVLIPLPTSDDGGSTDADGYLLDDPDFPVTLQPRLFVGWTF